MRPSARVKVLVADDHPVYRDGVAGALRRRAEVELVAEVGTGRESLEAIRRLAVDVAVLDFQMPDMDGVAVCAAVSRDALPTRVLFLSAYYDRDIVRDALAAGAHGFLSKDAKGLQISDAVLAVARGETVLGSDIQAALADEIRRAARRSEPALTGREHEILRLVADGHSAPQVAKALHLGTTTVKTHLQRIYEKLGVTDRAAAVAEAMRRGLLD